MGSRGAGAEVNNNATVQRRIHVHLLGKGDSPLEGAHIKPLRVERGGKYNIKSCLEGEDIKPREG